MREVLVLLSLAAAGYLTRVSLETALKSTGVFTATVKFLVGFVYAVLLPLSLTSIFARRGLLQQDLSIALYFALIVVIAYVISKRVVGEGYAIPVFLTSAFPNSVFLGFPVCYSLFGRMGVAAVIGVFTVLLNTLLPDAIAYRELPIKYFFKSTALIGFLAGLACHYLLGDYANVVAEYTSWSTALLSYLAMYLMGMRIPSKFSKDPGVWHLLLATGVFRFAIAPSMALLMALITGVDYADSVEFAVVSAMPPAVINVVVAEKYGWEPETVALITTTLTLFFLAAVLPVLYALFTHLRLT